MDYQSPDSLYNLLPAVYRIRDAEAEQGYRLKAFLRLIASQVNIVKEDIDRLWDNFFIETCDDWVVPYIGDLVANNPLHDVERPNRADVSKTIYYRRRKGTLAMLEELARDITGWSCHAVEFFQLLGWTQNVNHVRLQSKGCADIRDLNTMELVDTPFDSVSHTVDIRAINQIEGWYNIKNISFFLWRLHSYPLENVPARPVSGPGDYRYHFSTLGNRVSLFHHPLREGDEAGLAQEIHIPGPIRPAAFHFDLKEYQDRYENIAPGERPRDSNYYYGANRSLNIIKDGTSVAPMDVMCKDLRSWDHPPPGKVAVDVRLGRLAFALNEEPTQGVEVAFNFGFSADIGGGQYDRYHTLAVPLPDVLHIRVEKGSTTDTLQKALIQWCQQGRPPCIIQIQDNGIYGGNFNIELPVEGWLVIEAADGKRPSVRPVGNPSIAAPTGGGTLIFNGLVFEGGIELIGNLNLTITHCTLVPGRMLDEHGNPVNPERDSLVATGTDFSGLEVIITHSIVGPLRLPASSKHLTVQDSIIDAPGVKGNPRPAVSANDAGNPGPPTTLERITIFGKVCVRELTLASEVIFTDPVVVERQQAGYVRFSYVPPEGSQMPRQFRCQPALALTKRAKALHLDLVDDLPADERVMILARLMPRFTSVHYGHPAYCQLSYHCPEEIKTGAEDGSEMGIFRHLRQPQREANLRIRLEEYLPFGLKPGLIYIHNFGGEK